MTKKLMEKQQKYIGIIPAGGVASRLSPIPCSKEIYPVGFQNSKNGQGIRPKVACHFLLEKMKFAQADMAYIILREGKWDIPTYMGDGKKLGINLAYLMMDLPYGVPYTIDQAYPFVKDARIVFGFPDILFQPDDAFVRLIQKQDESNANIVIGLFPTAEPHKMDMVDFDLAGKVRKIQIKPDKTKLKYTWIIAVWDPVFTEFLHRRVNTFSDGKRTFQKRRELYLGDIFQAAIEEELNIDHVIFPEGNCKDIGTVVNLVSVVREQFQKINMSNKKDA